MQNRRLLVLGLVAVALASTLAWRWVSGWGLVSLDFKEAPVSKVIASIQRQSGVRIATNVDPSTPVTIQVRRAPVFEVLDLLAVRMEGEMRLSYVIAPDKVKLLEGAGLLSASGRPEGWRIFDGGWGGGMLPGDTIPDLRRVAVTLAPMGNQTLHDVADQTAQKAGVGIMVPVEWNPAVAKLPPSGRVSSVASALAKSAGGQSLEVVLISVRGRGEDGRQVAGGGGDAPRARPDGAEGGWQGGSRAAGQPRPEGAGGRDRGSWGGNPEWMAERVMAQIEMLPPEERAQARQDFAEMRKFWEEVRTLPQEERSAKIEEAMSRPEVQDRMDERMAQRDQKRTPQQRTERFRNYVERKEQAKQAQNSAR